MLSNENKNQLKETLKELERHKAVIKEWIDDHNEDLQYARHLRILLPFSDKNRTLWEYNREELSLIWSMLTAIHGPWQDPRNNIPMFLQNTLPRIHGLSVDECIRCVELMFIKDVAQDLQSSIKLNIQQINRILATDAQLDAGLPLNAEMRLETRGHDTMTKDELHYNAQEYLAYARSTMARFYALCIDPHENTD